MNYSPAQNMDPLVNPLDAVLADIAINIQLPPGLHSQACDRYESVRTYAERAGSPLAGKIVRFYPQGSMAIDATTSTRGTDDEYDLDIVAELDLDPNTPPGEVLDLLEKALRDYPVQKVIRQTRCVTLKYADRMHLDVTPAIRIRGGAERESHIFHAKPEHARDRHFCVSMNAWGFADWYRERTPFEEVFAKALNTRLYEAYGMAFDKAEHDEVPNQVPFQVKSVTTVALQLLKRFRNIVYADYPARIPPSVVLSYFAGKSAEQGVALSDMVVRQARAIVTAIRYADARDQKLFVTNPRYERDCFTDRWPENLTQQREFADRLSHLVSVIESAKGSNATLEELQDLLRDEFGERVVSKSIAQFNERLGKAVRGTGRGYSRTGRILVPSAPALITGAAVATRARAHTFMGGRLRD